MSQPPLPSSSSTDLQFDVVEAAVAPQGAGVVPQAMSCVACRRPIATTYFAVASKIVCASCAQQIKAGPSGSAAARVAKATVMGLGAGFLGAVVWFAIRRAAHLEIGLVAILVGFMVGKAVRKGSGGYGGLGYQILAVILTYGCIAANYMPDVFQAMVSAHGKTLPTMAQHSGDAVQAPIPNINAGQRVAAIALAITFVFVGSLALPFLSLPQNIIGLLIIAFALMQAWKLTARRKIPLTGPYQVGARVVAAAPAGVGT